MFFVFNYQSPRHQRGTIARIAAVLSFVIGLGGAWRNYLAIRDHEVWHDYQGNVVSAVSMHNASFVFLGWAVFGLVLFLLLLKRPSK
jgi:hypothetical protein